MAQFKPAYVITLGHEGGYVNDPVDRGGETYKGIARKFWPDWKGWALIDDLKPKPGFPFSLNRHSDLQELVQDFYEEHFWDALQLDRMIHQSVANELFDTAVNQGTGTAAKYLQKALNLLGNRLAVDGKVGPITLAAANAAPQNRLFNLINILQAERYLNIVRNDPSQLRFLNGWVKRVQWM